ncbi:MAG: 4-hydroxy-tetrahydrodipicolinate synthase [Deltaproteobacteria bacterium]|nr:4-hydroxy-tetrahydrodipicolinate synthase [Deltaproteobacteria bacterium]
MTSSPFKGVGTALITPFTAEGAVDYPSLEKLMEFQWENGVDFLVPLGTTGEVATLTGEEQSRIAALALQKAKGKGPVLMGCGGNNTREVIEKGLHLKSLGATHILSVSPYYNRPTQEGITQHFKAIRQQTGLEIMLYSIQARTGSNVEPATVARLAEEGIIFGIKEASGSILQIQKIVQSTPAGFQVFSGDDPITLPLMAVGGAGVIAVTSNVVPAAMSRWLKTLLAGDFKGGRGQLDRLLPLFEALGAEVNPIPVKGAASLLGLAQLHYRLPLVPPAPATMERLKTALAAFS